MKNKFTFIDLFAGIGGFHIAMENCGGKCVFASEIDSLAVEIYKENYGIVPHGDITTLDPKIVPEHDVLCAGFPCQPFSKAGFQKGFDDERGNLFFSIKHIIEEQQKKESGGPKIILLENVKNLKTHDHGNTWITIKKILKSLNYNVIDTPITISPNDVGVPQLRDRIVILAVKDIVYNEVISLEFSKKSRNTLKPSQILEENLSDFELDTFGISDYETKLLDTWDDFIKAVGIQTIGFPIWLDWMISDDDIASLPVWKQHIIQQNRDFYKKNKTAIKKWYKKHSGLDWARKSHRKLEWQAGTKINSIYDGIIQLRPSGVRVKQPTEFPALVAMVQIPIFGPQKRRITPREAARLQSFPDTFILAKNNHAAYKQFGNAVNVKVIETVFRKFCSLINFKIGGKKHG